MYKNQNSNDYISFDVLKDNYVFVYDNYKGFEDMEIMLAL